MCSNPARRHELRTRLVLKGLAQHARGCRGGAGVYDFLGPRFLFGLRLAASVCLALYCTYYLELQNSFWAATTAAIVCQPNLGASLQKGRYRAIGTIVGDGGVARHVPAAALFVGARQ